MIRGDAPFTGDGDATAERVRVGAGEVCPRVRRAAAAAATVLVAVGTIGFTTFLDTPAMGTRLLILAACTALCVPNGRLSSTRGCFSPSYAVVPRKLQRTQ